MLSLVNNLSSLIAQSNLNNSNSALGTSLQRLSSGLRINSGADDPAGLVISQEQRAQISGLQTAITNTSNAVNVVQIADGALNETSSLLLQIRGLAVSAANTGVNDTTSLAADQAQISNAIQTIDRIASTTRFGSTVLLNGGFQAAITSSNTAGATATGTSTTANGTYSVAISQNGTQSTDVGGTAYASGSAALLTGSQTDALTIGSFTINLNSTNAGTVNQAISTINSYQSQTGVTASLNGAKKILLTSTAYGSNSGFSVSEATGGGASALGFAASATAGLDVVGTITNQTTGVSYGATGSGNVLTGTNGLVLTGGSTADSPYIVTVNNLQFQIGANAGDTAGVAIGSADSTAIGQNATSSTNASGAANHFSNLNGINVTNSTYINDVLNVVDKAIKDVAALQGQLGAFQDNTLQATAANLQTALQNTTSADSTIRDTNFATETANFTQNQVLVQAGTQVLKNANQIPQLALTLLQ
jgi:flagellin